MEQNLPVQEQSFKSDSEPEEEARDTALLINGQDSKENLENDLILEPQKLSETEQNDTGEPVAKNPKLSEDLTIFLNTYTLFTVLNITSVQRKATFSGFHRYYNHENVLKRLFNTYHFKELYYNCPTDKYL